MQPTTLTPVNIALEIGRLDGVLATPNKAIGIVVFAQRIGGSRSAAHNNPVAAALQKKGIATLLFDLVTPVEDSRHGNRFNVDLLAARLQLATEWIWKLAGFADCPVGYFGIDIGGAAALRAAAHLGKRIRAVVSQGDRPDLAGQQPLAAVTAPTLLLVGGRDTSAIALNREALCRLTCEKQMHVIPGVKRLSDQPRTLQQVADQAASWFSHHLPV